MIPEPERDITWSRSILGLTLALLPWAVLAFLVTH